MNIEVVSPFPMESLPRVWQWIDTFRSSVTDDFGPKTLPAFVESVMQASQQQTWGVYRDGELGGMVTFQPVSAWFGTAHFLFKKHLWGFETTIPALRLVFEQIFQQGYGKIGGFPFHSNLQVKGVLNRLGAVKEGLLLHQTMCNGKPVDMWAYGLTKEGFEQNATFSSRPTHRSGNRRNQLHHRGIAGGKTEDSDQHDHAGLDTGHAATATAALPVQL